MPPPPPPKKNLFRNIRIFYINFVRIKFVQHGKNAGKLKMGSSEIFILKNEKKKKSHNFAYYFILRFMRIKLVRTDENFQNVHTKFNRDGLHHDGTFL